MKMKTIWIAWAALLLATPVQAQVRVFASGAVSVAVQEAGVEFTRQTGKSLEIISGTTGVLQKRLLAGEKADAVVMAAPVVDELIRASALSAEDRADLARGLIGVGVRKGAPAPDLSSAETFKAALLAAKSVSYVHPAAGGTTGIFFEKQVAAMGIAEILKAKTVYGNQGSEVAAAVANGQAELGITFTSELRPNPGVAVAGVLPAPFQNPTVYAAAVVVSTKDRPSAQTFIQVLSGPAGQAAFRKSGLEIVTP